jgi:diguanylate cyclase (GGDEF)-like protein
VRIALADSGAVEAPAASHKIDVPIRFRNENLGTLTIESASPELFTPAHVIAFELFAAQVAGAIHLASVKEALDQRSRDLEEANAHLSRAIETLHRISTTDPLSGVANRRQFDDALALEWRRAVRGQTPLSLLMIDIDFFKPYNDAYGHQAGDECIRSVAQALQQRIHRAGDLVARYGGEEFAVLLAGIDAAHARELAERTREAVAALAIEHRASSAAKVVTISVGVATVVPQRDGSPSSLVSVADAALYAAKKAGRNRVEAVS